MFMIMLMSVRGGSCQITKYLVHMGGSIKMEKGFLSSTLIPRLR